MIRERGAEYSKRFVSCPRGWENHRRRRRCRRAMRKKNPQTVHDRQQTTWTATQRDSRCCVSTVCNPVPQSACLMPVRASFLKYFADDRSARHTDDGSTDLSLSFFLGIFSDCISHWTRMRKKKKSTLLVRRVRINGSKKTFRWFPTTVRELSLVWLVLGRGIRLVTHDGIYFDCLITKKRKEMMNIPDSLDVVTKEREGIGNVSASGWPTFYRGLCLRPPFFVFQVPPTPLGRRRPSFTIRQTQRTYKKKGMLPESKWRREGARYWVVVSSWLTGGTNLHKKMEGNDKWWGVCVCFWRCHRLLYSRWRQ